MSNILETVDLRVALNKVQKRSSEIVISEYFVKDSNEDYIFKNLNATCQLLEKESPALLKKLVEANSGKKLTLKQFHRVLINVLNQ